jgi:nicotinamidase-related amidase
MKMSDETNFLQNSLRVLTELYETVNNQSEVTLSGLSAASTVLVLVDLVNGFTRTGALQSPRVNALIPGVVRLSKACDQLGIAKLAFADSHSDVSPEFAVYPVHCLAGTDEAEIVAEIKTLGGYHLIAKNSTNGFLEAAFQEWLTQNREITSFIVVGDCTDICVQQFATTLKTWFNSNDRKVRVIVPVDLVDTYDLGMHNAELMNVMALFNMMVNGVEVVKKISLPQ